MPVFHSFVRLLTSTITIVNTSGIMAGSHFSLSHVAECVVGSMRLCAMSFYRLSISLSTSMLLMGHISTVLEAFKSRQGINNKA